MKSGFVMLAGRSNVGKSTLLNALIGTKVAIVTPKPQTTRHPVRGILHDTRGQLVFVDTPGVFLGKKDKVSKRLNQFVSETLEGVDIVVYVMDPTREAGAEEEHIQKMLRATKVPIILVINKTDEKSAKNVEACRTTMVGQRKTLEISALKHKNLNHLIDALFELSPDGPPHYPELQLTDIGHNQWLEELIREKIFLALDKELPYSIKVSLEESEIRGDHSRFIHANIWTTEERYKRMIIGAKGSMLKRIGSAARKELEAVTESKVFLELHVKVDPKWQERFA
ncbi:MAG: GTPase Era [Patescibacteria group bacterium]